MLDIANIIKLLAKRQIYFLQIYGKPRWVSDIHQFYKPLISLISFCFIVILIICRQNAELVTMIEGVNEQYVFGQNLLFAIPQPRVAVRQLWSNVHVTVAESAYGQIDTHAKRTVKLVFYYYFFVSQQLCIENIGRPVRITKNLDLGNLLNIGLLRSEGN